MRSCWLAIMALSFFATGAAAQVPPPIILPIPNPNPSSSLVLPPPSQIPVWPVPRHGARGGQLYYPHSLCSVFRRGPCLPYYLPPIGQDLRLTIVSTDENSPKAEESGSIPDDDHALNTIREMFATLRACWTPPQKTEARHGMEYTIRFAFKRDGSMIATPRRTYSTHEAPAATRDAYRAAIDAALGRCTPLHFSEGMAQAIAGRPIAIRFVDDRTISDQGDSP
jgi:hypothetical protein